MREREEGRESDRQTYKQVGTLTYRRIKKKKERDRTTISMAQAFAKHCPPGVHTLQRDGGARLMYAGRYAYLGLSVQKVILEKHGRRYMICNSRIDPHPNLLFS